jgi:hypothetical protein
VADKLALFVAKNGRQFEDITRQKNPGNTAFRFPSCYTRQLQVCNNQQESMALAELLLLDDLVLCESGL